MKKLILALAVTGFASASAFAQSSFEEMDSDKDGSVTLTEAVAAGATWTTEQFAAADKDQSGGLDADEYAAATQ